MNQICSMHERCILSAKMGLSFHHGTATAFHTACFSYDELRSISHAGSKHQVRHKEDWKQKIIKVIHMIRMCSLHSIHPLWFPSFPRISSLFSLRWLKLQEFTAPKSFKLTAAATRPVAGTWRFVTSMFSMFVQCFLEGCNAGSSSSFNLAMC